MPVEYSEDPEARTVEFTLSGRMTREDYDRVVKPMQAFIDTHGKVRMIEIIESFDGFDPSILWPGLKFDIRNLQHVSHVAVVSDIGWISPMAKAAGALISTRLRTFEMSELEQARTWVRSAD